MKAKAEELFVQASSLEGKDREAFLLRACGEDARLRQEVQRLLVDSEKADSFFGDVEGKTIAESEFDEEAFLELEGDVVGPYILRQKIGEGGFGVVWMAEQSKPISRMVALKVVKAGMDTKQVLARFEAERQALAMMDHANIARVLDAGATPAGRPYFAMELVKGIPITQFCREQKLNTKERLALFQDVCSAVNHAHQKGVIHRDLKPCNVMVTLEADKPIAKVIDFGIAKATQSKLTEKTLFTRFEQFLGTPVYMSPEQAAMSNLDVDTRSDIYSLGVLLYELLAGQPPFDAKTLLSAGYDEMRRIIKEDQPPKPSTRLTQTQATSSHAIRNDPHITPKTLRGELDWIVMKAIEKDRTRRYETANAFAADIGRYLDDEPVHAVAPSAAYKFRKFAQRNKVALAVGALIVLVLSGATTVSTWQARWAKESQAESEQARMEAEAISAFLTDMFKSPRPGEENSGPTVTVAEILDKATEKLEQDTDYPPNRRAELQWVIGETYRNVGLSNKALPLLKKVSDHFLATSGPKNKRTLSSMNDLASNYMAIGESEKAIRMYEMLQKDCQAELGPEDRTTLQVIGNLANAYAEIGDWEKAMPLLQKTSLSFSDPENLDTAYALNNLAEAYNQTGQPEKALPILTDVLEQWGKSLDSKHPVMLGVRLSLANYHRKLGAHETAKEIYQELAEDCPGALGTVNRITLGAMNGLARCYMNADQPDKAAEIREKVLNACRAELAPEDITTLNAMTNLADALRKVDFPRGMEMQKEALDLKRLRLPKGDPNILIAMRNMALYYEEDGHIDMALAMWTEVLPISIKSLGQEHATTLEGAESMLAIHQKAGSLEDGLDTVRTAMGEDHPITLKAMHQLANIAEAKGSHKEAFELRKVVYERRSELLDLEHPDRLGAMTNLAISYRRANQLTEAIALQEESLEMKLRVLPPGADHTVSAISNLVNCYIDAGETEKAIVQWQDKVDLLLSTTRGAEHPRTIGEICGLARFCFYDGGKQQKAVEMLEEIRQFPPAVAQLGYFYHDSAPRETDKAIAAWQEALSVFTKDAKTHYLLGKLLSEQLRYEKAVLPLQVACKLSPIHSPQGVESRRLLAQAFMKLGDDTAAADMRRQIDGLPTVLDAHAPTVLAKLIKPNSTWRWLHPTDGVDPAEADSNFHTTFFTGDYDDTSWQTGKDSEGPTGGFGYGDSSGVDIGTPDSKELGKSAYFRHSFKTEKAHDNLELRYQRDDGTIIYLDGVEVARDNMKDGPEAYRLAAKDSVKNGLETTVYRIPLQGGLAPGDHILAISLHNTEAPSSDLRIAGITLVEVSNSDQ